MTKILPPQELVERVHHLENRIAKLEREAPVAIAFKDANSQIRVVIGKLDVLGGGYVGKYGWVVLDGTGALVAAQYA